MTRTEAIEKINARQNAENLFTNITEEDIKAEMSKEDTTMKPNQFTYEGQTFYTNAKGTYFYCIKSGKDKADRIPECIYDEAKELYDAEQAAKAAQAELDAEPCTVTPDLEKPAVIDENGCVNCRECNAECVHRDCMRRNPRAVGGLGECPRLSNKPEEDEAKDPELEQIAQEIPGIEPADAELEKNARKEKKARKAAKATKAVKPRKSKDIAYESTEYGVTLTAKQVDFIRHIPDTCFYERGLDSSIWVDVLCDEIGGQFTEKPMTVGAMISTLCEKGLGARATERRDGRKCTAFSFTIKGRLVARELGLE